MKKTIALFSLTFLFVLFSFNSCTDEDIDLILGILEAITLENGETVGLGLVEDTVATATIPNDIYLAGESTTLPSKVDLSPYFPPIKAVGYYVKSALEAIDLEYSSAQLQSEEYQFSPKDLFLSISNRGSNCNGSFMGDAFDVLLNRGIATLSDVPYQDLGKCAVNSASNEPLAAPYLIENYRKIFYRNPDDVWSGTPTEDINTLKSYLAQNRPIAICAKLGENFMKCSSSEVLKWDTKDYKGQHSYHAMSLCGYDDSRNAFRVVNSWGEDWGDNGFIWVDYSFFVNQFCYLGYVAKNIPSNYNPYDDVVTYSGADLISWNLVDEDYTDAENPYRRFITYDVYNVGDETVYAIQDWSILYVYYNAYDATDYGILIYDYYSDDYGDNDNHYGVISDDTGYGSSENWWNNIDVPSNTSAAQALLGSENFSFDYDLPSNLTGKYYMVLIADGFNAIEEYNEANNYLYFSAEDNQPLNIKNGVILNAPTAKSANTNKSKTMYIGMESPKQSVSVGRNKNAYTTDEIRKLIDYQKKTGNMDKKIKEYQLKLKQKGLNTEKSKNQTR